MIPFTDKKVRESLPLVDFITKRVKKAAFNHSSKHQSGASNSHFPTFTGLGKQEKDDMKIPLIDIPEFKFKHYLIKLSREEADKWKMREERRKNARNGGGGKKK